MLRPGFGLAPGQPWGGDRWRLRVAWPVGWSVRARPGRGWS